MNIRAVYGTPCRSQYFCKRSNVSGTVDVRVRHVTTMGTNEAVFMPFPQFVAYGARLARVCRIHIIHSYPNTLRLVSHKVLQLSPRPSVQPCTHSFSGFDPVTNMGQVFQTNLGRAAGDSFSNNVFGYNVIYMRDVPTFIARDFAKTLFCALRTVGLETPTMSEVFISIMPQFTTIEHATAGSGRDVVFPDIATHDTVSSAWGGIRHIKDQIEKPLAFIANQFRFRCGTLRQKVRLIFAKNKWHLLTAIHGEQRKGITLDAIGPLVEVYRLWLEYDQRNRFVFADTFIGFKRFVCARHFVDGIAGHLTAKVGILGTHGMISQVVQRDSVPAAMFLCKRNNGVTCRRKRFSQTLEGFGLFFSVKKLDRYSAFHIG